MTDELDLTEFNRAMNGSLRDGGSMQHVCQPHEIFVFGSNLRGAHGAGAAKDAVEQYGAKYGQESGLQGQSYAIPTKDRNIETLPLANIQEYVESFIDFARANPNSQFFLTRIGCGLAGYSDEDIAPLFRDAPPNVRRPPGW